MGDHVLSLDYRRRALARDEQGYAVWQMTEERVTLPCHRTALLLCDVWDRHWSRGAMERLDAMIPRMNRVVDTMRSLGVQIIHAPSDTMGYYAGHPARKRALALDVSGPPVATPHADPPLPVDAEDHGSDTGETEPYRAWSRQHPGIEIDLDLDLISDEGERIAVLMGAHGREHLLIMGVHTNMCVLHRTFGIKQMVRWGVDVALIRDLTDTMYNPASPPYVSHDEGTRLVIEYIEKFWCPSVSSERILGDVTG